MCIRDSNSLLKKIYKKIFPCVDPMHEDFFLIFHVELLCGWKVRCRRQEPLHLLEDVVRVSDRKNQTTPPPPPRHPLPRWCCSSWFNVFEINSLWSVYGLKVHFRELEVVGRQNNLFPTWEVPESVKSQLNTSSKPQKTSRVNGMSECISVE